MADFSTVIVLSFSSIIILGCCIGLVRMFLNRQNRTVNSLIAAHPVITNDLNTSRSLPPIPIPTARTRTSSPSHHGTARPIHDAHHRTRVVLNPNALSRDQNMSELQLQRGQCLSIIENFDDNCLALNPITGESGLVPFSCFLPPPCFPLPRNYDNNLPAYPNVPTIVISHTTIPMNDDEISLILNDLPPAYESHIL